MFDVFFPLCPGQQLSATFELGRNGQDHSSLVLTLLLRVMLCVSLWSWSWWSWCVCLVCVCLCVWCAVRVAPPCIQNVPVYAGTTRTCASTCARGAGKHGDVLNVHTEAFLNRHTGGRRQFCLPRKAHLVFSHSTREVHQRNPWILHIFSLRIDREQHVPDSSNHSSRETLAGISNQVVRLVSHLLLPPLPPTTTQQHTTHRDRDRDT